MKRLDLTIGQRLAIGFGILLLVLGTGIGYLFVVQEDSSAAQARFVEQVAPRTALANELQRAIMYVGISARSYLITPTEERMQLAKDRIKDVGRVLQELSAIPMGSEDRELFGQLEPLADDYLQAVNDVIVQSETSEISGDQEQRLSDARVAVFEPVQSFIESQAVQEREALAEWASARKRVREGFIAISFLALLAFLAVAALTARSIRRPARDLVSVAEALQAGNYHPALKWASHSAHGNGSASEMTSIARAFGSAASALEHRERRLRADAKIAAATSSSLDKAKVGEAVLAPIAEHVQAEIAALYWATEDSMVPIAQRALNGAARPVPAGEGVLGYAASQRQPIVIRDIPADTPFAVRVGYDAAPPRSIAVVPIYFQEELLGVMVLASLRDFDQEAMTFLAAVSQQLAVGFRNVRSHEEIEQLVIELRESNEQIQAQSEELQAQNEEIQAQNEEISAQQEELQAQNEELQAQNEEIHNQNAEIRTRSAELEELSGRLITQTRLLESADERKNEFLAMLAHELRNPMAALTTSLELLDRSESGSSRAAKAREAIARQMSQLVRLIDDLLDITRISQGKIHVQRTRVDLAQIVRACASDQMPAFDADGIVLETEIPTYPVWVDGDSSRLHQVVNNLLHNAMKFTDEGRRVWLRLETTDDGVVVVEVGDEGIGIEPSMLPHLFEPFRQGANGSSRANTGLGLGLTLVKTLVELHNGEVQAHSDGPGKGARFTVRLPVVAGAMAVKSQASERKSSRSWRVLLVEDNSFIAWSLREMLELEGHVVEVAATGGQALKQAATMVPELVLCDIGLPDMDGFAVGRTLRDRDELKETIFIALTGYSSKEDRSRSAEAGFVRHLVKPLDLPAIRALLVELEEEKQPVRMLGNSGCDMAPEGPMLSSAKTD